MDLIEAFKRTFELLRSNLILFLPPLVFAYLIPAALAPVGLYIFVPIMIVAARSPAPILVLGPRGAAAVLIIIVLAMFAYSYVLAAWAGMNKKAALSGSRVSNSLSTIWYRLLLGGARNLAPVISSGSRHRR